MLLNDQHGDTVYIRCIVAGGFSSAKDASGMHTAAVCRLGRPLFGFAIGCGYHVTSNTKGNAARKTNNAAELTRNPALSPSVLPHGEGMYGCPNIYDKSGTKHLPHKALNLSGEGRGSSPNDAVDPDPYRPDFVAASAQAAHGHIAVCGHIRPHTGQQRGQCQ